MDDETLDRFWDKVVPMMDDRGCWEWSAATFPKPRHYGCFHIRGKRGMQKAHRISWEIHNGQIPEGLCVLHRCDNPSCVNPGHLFLGTQGDNIRDMHKKRRAWQYGRPSCKNGHPWTPENTNQTVRQRQCRTCRKRIRAQNYARTKLKRNSQNFEVP